MFLFGVKFRNNKVIEVNNCSRAEISSAQSCESLALIDDLHEGMEYQL